jgi:hypothetical protein
MDGLGNQPMGLLFFNSLLQASICPPLLILIYPDDLAEADWLLAYEKRFCPPAKNVFARMPKLLL